MGSFSIWHWLIMFVVGVPIIAIYNLPTMIAIYRRNENAMAVHLLNIFLGWTLIGWVAALILAVQSRPNVSLA